MDMNNVNIEEIVKQVLSGMTGNAPQDTTFQKYDRPYTRSIMNRIFLDIKHSAFVSK